MMDDAYYHACASIMTRKGKNVKYDFAANHVRKCDSSDSEAIGTYVVLASHFPPYYSPKWEKVN